MPTVRTPVPSLLLLLLLTLPSAGEQFIPPVEGKSLFHREKLSLDPDSIRELSTHLTDLSRREMRGDPAQLRATAQFLALATRLQPANRHARDLVQSYRRGEPARQNGSDPNKALTRTWRIVSWLRQPEAGAEGQKLASLVLDPLRVVDPQHPHAKAHDPSGEHARWQGVVPALSRYQERVRTIPPTPEKLEPAIPEPDIPRAPIVLRAGSLKTVLFTESEQGQIVPHLTTVAMKVTSTGTKDPFDLVLGPDQPVPPALKHNLLRSLQEQGTALPLGEQVTLSIGSANYPAANQDALSGPAVLLLQSAFSGIKLRPDLVVLGRLDPKDRLEAPRASWEILQFLREAKEGGILCVPQAMLPEIRSLLALEIPEFFLTWEIYTAETIADLRSLLSGALDEKEVIAARPHYRELRSLGANSDVGQLCVKTDTRNRLDAILSLIPNHASARMLQLQGSALERPTRIEQAVTARLLANALSGLEPLINSPLEELTPTQIGILVKVLRQKIDLHQAAFHQKDAALHEEAGEVIQSATTLGVALRAASVDPTTGQRLYQEQPVSFYQDFLKARLANFRQSIFRFTERVPGPDPDSGEGETNPTPR